MMLIKIRRIIKHSPALFTWLICSLIAQNTFAGQMLVDKTVDGVKPMVLTAPNGVPLVNISTPSSNGVSKNQFIQFDVNSEGAILNNSIDPVATQLGGYVAGNNQLGYQPARIILNQVNGNQVSQLNGYLEVAGQQAEVIIANENGITCNGCGFINTSDMTLTSGQTQFNGSGAAGYQVKQGTIQVAGEGLNASNIKDLKLLGRHVAVNGPIYAQALQLVAGVNEIDSQDQVTRVNSHLVTEKTLAIDTGALGGIYANSIRLISNETGLGVNVEGTVLAQEGTLQIDSQGKLTISSLVQSNTQLDINTAEGMTLAEDGKIESRQTMTIASQDDVSIVGSVTSLENINVSSTNLDIQKSGDISSKQVQLTAQQKLAFQGTLASEGNITVNANDVEISGQLAASKDIEIQAQNNLTTSKNNKIITAENAHLSAVNMSLSEGNLEASENLVIAAEDTLQLQDQVVLGAKLTMSQADGSQNKSVSIKDSYIGSTQSQTIESSQVTITQTKQNSADGKAIYSLVSDDDISITADNFTDNNSQLFSAGDLTVSTTNNVTSTGKWTAGRSTDGTQSSKIQVTSEGQITLTDATLIANDDVLVTASKGITTDNTRLQADDQLHITDNNTSQSSPTKTHNSRLVAKDITFTSSHIDAHSSQGYASNNINFGTTRLQSVGQWVANNDLTLQQSDNLSIASNEHLKANKSLNIQTKGAVENKGFIQGESIELSATTLTNQGEIAGENLNATHQSQTDRSLNQPIHTLVNEGKLIVDKLDLALHTFTNQGGVVQGNSIQLDAHTITNQDGTAADGSVKQGIVQAQGNLTLVASDTITHQDTASLEADGNTQLSANTLDLHSRINSDGNVTIKGNTINITNQVMAGVISTKQSDGSTNTTYNNKAQLTLDADEQLNLTGNSQVQSAGDIHLSADQLTGVGTQLTSTGNTQIQLDTRAHFTNSHLNSHDLTILGKLDAQGQATRVGDVTLQDSTLAVNNDLAMTAGHLIASQTQLTDAKGNPQYTLQSNGDATLNLVSLNIGSGRLYSQGTSHIDTTGNTSISGLWVAGNTDNASDLSIQSGGHTTLSQATVDAKGNLTITAQQGLNATQSRLQAQKQLALTVNGTSNANPANLSNSTLTATDIKVTGAQLNADNTQAHASNNIAINVTGIQALGQWVADNDLTVNSVNDLAISNTEYLKAGNTLTATTQGKLSNQGTLQGKTLELQATTLTNQGEIAGENLNATHQSQTDRSLNQPIHTLVNEGKLIVDKLDLALHTFTNQGGVVQGNSIQLDAHTITNQDGTAADGSVKQGIVQAQGNLTLVASDTITHQDTASLEADGNTQLSANTLDLHSRINSDGNVTIKGNTINITNQVMAGVISTKQSDGSTNTTYNNKAQLTLDADEQLNLTGNSQVQSAGDIHLSADQLTGVGTQLTSTGNTQIQLDTRAHFTNSHLNSHDLTILGKLDAQGQATRVGDVTLQDSTLAVNNDLAMTAGHLIASQTQLTDAKGNPQYTLQSNGDATLNLVSLNIGSGRLYSQGTSHIDTTGNTSISGLWVAGNTDNASDLSIQSGGHTTLSQATVDAKGNLTITAQQGLNATQSRLQAQKQLALTVNGTSNANPANLSNSTLTATDIKVTGAQLNADNTQAHASNNIAINVTGIQALGQWVADNDLTVNSVNDLAISNTEYLKAGNTLTATTQGKLSNQGTLQGKTLELQATTLTNQGEIAGENLNATHQSQTDRSLNQPIHTLVNEGKLIVDNLDLALNKLVNNNGKIQAKNINIAAANIVSKGINSQIVADTNITLAASGHVYTNGVVAAGANVNIQGNDVTLYGAVTSGLNKATQQVTNVQGNMNIAASNRLYSPAHLKAGGALQVSGRLSGIIDIPEIGASSVGADNLKNLWSGEDMGFNLIGDYTHDDSNNWASYGNLNLQLSGNLYNNKDLTANKSLSINAANITNTKRLAGNQGLNLTTSGNITNSGVLEADNLVINAVNVTNNKDIIGDNITMSLVGNYTQDGSNRLLAASNNLTMQLDGTLTNAHGAEIYSLGNITIQGKSGSRATSVVNDSAKIVADGDIHLAANTVTNRRDTPVYRAVTTELENVVNREGPQLSSCDSYCRNWLSYTSYTVKKHGYVIDQEEAKSSISSNRNLLINTSSLNNEYSEIAAKATLQLGTYTTNSAVSNSVGGVTVHNKAIILEGKTIKTGKATNMAMWKKCFFGFCSENYYTVVENINEVISTNSISFPSTITGGAVSINAKSVNNGNVSITGNASQNTSLINTSVLAQASYQQQGGTQTSQKFLNGIAKSDKSSSSQLHTVQSQQQTNNDAQQGAGAKVVDSDDLSMSHLTYVEAMQSQNAILFNGLKSLTLANLRLPNNGLFKFQTNPSHGYLIETNQRFTDRETFLGSDYLLSGINAITEKMLRIGDGFYEARLVAQQIAELTAGQQLLESYPSKAEQYKGLMDNAIAQASQLALRPGVALSALQIAQLNGPLVWLVEKSVQTPNGDFVNVLVPVVYLTDIGFGNLLDNGTVIAGTDVNINATESIINQGAINSTNSLALTSAGDITNQGNISAGSLDINANNNITNQGAITATTDLALTAGNNITDKAGVINAQGNLSLQADNNIDLQAVAENSTTYIGNTTTQSTTQRTSQLNSGGNLTITAGNNLTAAGSDFTSQGEVNLTAGKDLNLLAVQETSNSRTGDSRNYSTLATNTANTTTIASGKGIALTAGTANIPGNGGNIVAEGILLDTTQGDITLAATGNVELNAASNMREESSQSITTDSGLFSSTTTTKRTQETNNTATVSELITNGNITISAGQNLNSVGTQMLASTGGITLNATGDVVLDVATNNTQQDSQLQVRESGLSFSGGGLFIGNRQEGKTQAGDTTTNIATTLLGNSVQINTGADVGLAATQIAATGSQNAVINAANINDITVVDVDQQTTTSSSQSSGLSIGSNAQLITSGVALDNTIKRYEGARSNKLKGALALQGLDQFNTLKDVAEQGNPIEQIKAGGVSVSLGQSSSESSQTTTTNTVRQTRINADTIQLNAQATIQLQGAELTGQTVNLNAGDSITLESASQSQTQNSHSTSQSSSIGVGISGGSIASVNASYSDSKGQQQSQSSEQIETTVNAQNFTLNSGGDSSLTGAVVNADSIQGQVGGDLTIASTQDTRTYASQNQSQGVSISVSLPGSPGVGNASFNQSQTDATANYQAVQAQSGLFAGEGGFDITVAGTATLNAGAIDSEADATQNRLVTNDLQVTTLDNTSTYDIDSSGISLSTSALGNSAGSTEQSDNQSNTTQAVLAQGDIQVKQQPDFDPNNTEGLTTDANDNQVLANTFNEADVQLAQEDVQAQQILGPKLADKVGTYATDKLNQADALRIQAKASKDPEAAARLNQQAEQLEQDWGESGTLRTLAHGLASGLTGGSLNASLGGAASTLAADELAGLQNQLAGVLQKVGVDKELSKSLAGLASATGVAAVGDAVGGSNAAVTAFNTDANNRQLHTTERQWIQDNAADYAEEQGISEEDALTQLTRQAERQVDEYAATQYEENANAAAFISQYAIVGANIDSTTGTGEFVNDNQTMFTANNDQFEMSLINAQTTLADPNISDTKKMELLSNFASWSQTDLHALNVTERLIIATEIVKLSNQEGWDRAISGIMAGLGQAIILSESERSQLTPEQKGQLDTINAAIGQDLLLLAATDGRAAGKPKPQGGSSKTAAKDKGAEVPVNNPPKTTSSNTLPTKYENRVDVQQRTAADVNADHAAKGNQPPYKTGTQVVEYTTKEADQFVRVHGDGNAARPWLMRKEAVEGLTAEQIQRKYSLPSKPTFISDVEVPAGTRIRTGKVETNFEIQGGGGQGATQYEWLNTKVPRTAISNTRKID